MIKLNGKPVDVTMFPDKTSQVWKLPEKELYPRNAIVITWDFEHEGELMHLAQLVHLARACENNRHITLFMPYLPYARQDKKVSNDESFALATFGWMMSTLKIDNIEVLDAHSEISEVYGFKNKRPSVPIITAVESSGANTIVLPDAGAERYSFFEKVLLKPFVRCEKVRNQKTGYIEHFKVLEGDVKGKKCMILDDICDGGMTFKICAESLLKLGASEVYLYTTHGIYSKGLDVLKESGISKIYNRNGKVDKV